MSESVVKTQYGTVKGISKNGVQTWKGIPYAKPPVGQLRFKAPDPPAAWEGVLDATAYGPVCPQPPDLLSYSYPELPRQSEDCLYVNVFAPDTPGKNRPVMVWIHGGTFYLGAGSEPLYDGSNLAAQGDVIVVTLNYRLGPFGFLHLSSIDEAYSNNLGLLDQTAALKWVKDNISAFGGDPENVTVFGESAGGMSIAALLAMPAAKGLFQKAILESGSSRTMTEEKAANTAHAFLRILGIDRYQLDRLHTVSAEDLLKAADQLRKTENENIFQLFFQPALDPKTLPAEPEKAIAEGAADGIPLLIGTNRDEGYLFFTPDSEVHSQETIDEALEYLLGQPLAKKAAELYPRSLESQIHIMTDLLFWRPAVACASAQSRYAPVWMYRFDWHPDKPPYNKAFHALELPFVFGNLNGLKRMVQADITDEVKQLSHTIQSAWLAFAKTGNPSCEDVQWPAYTEDKRETLILNSELSIEHDPDGEKRKKLLNS
ncbi:carboxylesterase/lipase family protein [Bacillus halotolerans]|uniref:carboxylesterase/lipase family protein n=1 Tax=Bacillus halotolerans TaxID=260554 RepID=UPI000D0277E0|nr:carboxylesterase/lipase family protein [Bacillus halotolerans]MCP9297601.1 carboxylesterase/lipase family protein [Bacillus halotolerans]MEC3638985.1 carboxylesterase/lipase family protein [Bacillus halotolerans]PRS06791.1 para-nitrobenzyl esterase [Bacillus halotolerans]PRS25757.1 para-nitrobenzyl esterase [Bacillus halotolerans]QKS06080.1 carboxylesterase/lipase family protein [Bacillus halotolerans]